MIQAFHLVLCICCKLFSFLICYCVLAISVRSMFGYVLFRELLVLLSSIFLQFCLYAVFQMLTIFLKPNESKLHRTISLCTSGASLLPFLLLLLPCLSTVYFFLQSCAYLGFLQCGIRNLNTKSTFQNIFANIFDQFQQLHCICANTLHKKQVLTFSLWVSLATWKTFKAFFCHGKFVLLWME